MKNWPSGFLFSSISLFAKVREQNLISQSQDMFPLSCWQCQSEKRVLCLLFSAQVHTSVQHLSPL